MVAQMQQPALCRGDDGKPRCDARHETLPTSSGIRRRRATGEQWLCRSPCRRHGQSRLKTRGTGLRSTTKSIHECHFIHLFKVWLKAPIESDVLIYYIL